MQTSVKIGQREERFEVPDDELIEVMHARELTSSVSEQEAVTSALAHPIGTPRLDQLVHPSDQVMIITSDCTRPLPTPVLLGPVLDELHAAGVADSHITFAVALGSHRPQTEKELKTIFGPYYGHYSIVNGGDEFISFGHTKHGTPIDILTPIAESTFRIALGNVEYHYFAGYSGGAKAIMPGVSTSAAIEKNHSLMLDDAAHAGNMESPVRLDVEEACHAVGLNFIVNAVLDEDHHVVFAAAGEVVKAHRVACKKLDELFGCPLSEQADIVVDSQGGAPKDLNLYQLQKALENAKYPVRNGGIIILVGSCQDGLGNPTFEQWMHEAKAPQDVIDRLNKKFVLGGHKAAAIARVEQKASVYLVSDLPDEAALDCFMTPYHSLQKALDAARGAVKSATHRTPRILVMPAGGSTLPLMQLNTQ